MNGIERLQIREIVDDWVTVRDRGRCLEGIPHVRLVYSIVVE